jgi:hypothetical protein
MSMKPVVHTIESLKTRCIEEGDCWLWQSRVKKSGRKERRATPVIGRKAVPVRRVMAELKTRKAVAPGLVASPSCGNALCVNPDHVAVQTVAEARAMAASFGAYVNPNRILKATLTMRAKSAYTEDVIRAIRSAPTGIEAAQLTGINLGYVYEIRSGNARRELNNPFAGLMR